MIRWKRPAIVLLALVLAGGVAAGVFVSVSGGTNDAPAKSKGSSAARGTAATTVPCFDMIGHKKSGGTNGYRVVLGVASVPRANLSWLGPVKTHQRPWAYWQKMGLLIRTGSPPVLVSVPRAWRKRVAITWGNSRGVVSALRFGHCPQLGSWFAYAGGFYLKAPACVPLDFQVGGKSKEVWFGLGRRCSASRAGSGA